MSLMAGYDIVVEFSHELLLKLIKSNLKFGGAPVSPPFDLEIPFAAPGLPVGVAHIIVSDVALTINGGDTVSIALPFYNGSFTAGPVTVSALDGTISIKAIPVSMVAGTTQYANAVAVNLGTLNCTADITFSNGSIAKINSLLAPLGVNADAFKNLVSSTLTTYVHSLGVQQFPLEYQVHPGQDGNLSPLQFESLEVHCVPQAQTICLCGILDAARHGAGDFAAKTSTAVVAGNNLAISIGPQAFHKFCFVPAVAKQMNVTPSQLPPSCGPSSGLDYSGATVTYLADDFAAGHIDINGAMSKSGTCYEGHGTFHGALTLSLKGNGLKPNVVLDEPDIDIDIPWYCWLAAAVAGPFFLVAAGVVKVVAEGIVTGLAKSALDSALTQGLSPVAVGGIEDVQFGAVEITPEGISVNGNATVFVPLPEVQGLDLVGSVVTIAKTLVAQGVFHSTALGAVGDYNYTEYAQQQVGTYQIVTKLLGHPLTVECWISDPLHLNQKVQLNGGSGNVVLQGFKCEYDLPLPSGTPVTQDVHLGYTITQDMVELKNVPTEGDFDVLLHVRVTDPLGNSKEGIELVQFDGNFVDCPQFWEDRANFFERLRAIIAEKRKMLVRDRIPFPPVDDPPPEVIDRYVRDLIEREMPEADVLLAFSKMLHAATFRRTIAKTAAKMIMETTRVEPSVSIQPLRTRHAVPTL